MSRRLLTIAVFAVALTSQALAQQAPAAPAGGRGAARVTRPPLFFKEEWKQTEKGGEHPIVFDSTLSNPALELKVYITLIWQGLASSTPAANPARS